MGSYFAVTSPDRQRTSSTQNSSTVQFKIIRSLWLATFNDSDAREISRTDRDSQQWQSFYISDEFIILEGRVKDQEVRPTCKAFDDILTDHAASQTHSTTHSSWR